MRRYLALAAKKISVLFGGRPLLFPLMLAVLALLFYTVGEVNGAEHRAEAVITIVDESATEYSAALADAVTRTEGFTVRTAHTEEEALADIADGRSEAVLIIKPDYSEKLFMDEIAGAVKLMTAPGSAVQDLIRETVSGRLLAQRAYARVRESVKADGLDAAEFDRLCDEFEMPRIYKVASIGGGSGIGRAVFGQGFPGCTGFTALAMMLIMLTVTRMLSEASSKLAGRRLLALEGGRALGFVSDALACLAVTLSIAAVSFALSPDRSLALGLASAAYSLELTGLVLLVSRIVGAGRIDVASPFIALVTSIFGGCFADTASLSPALKIVSYFTPQGRFIAAASGAYHFAAIMAALGLVFACLALAAERKSEKA